MLKEIGGEVRFKEYIPIPELHMADMKDPKSIESALPAVERLSYRADSIPGMSRTEYMNFLFPPEFER